MADDAPIRFKLVKEILSLESVMTPDQEEVLFRKVVRDHPELLAERPND